VKFEEISSREDFEDHFFHDKGFVYIDEETFRVDKEHKAKYRFEDNLNYSKAYQLYREMKGVHMTPYYIFIDNDFDVYYIFSEYHTPFKFVYDKNRRERDYTKQSRLQLLNSLEYEDRAYNDSFQSLFDTKPLVKRFYDEYRIIKTRLSKSLKGLDDDERWFYSQVLLDRIIFIYFLQSRRIIKEDYLSNLYRNRDTKKNFFNDYLKPLFFNAFNYDHPFYENVEVNGVNLGNVPYLNGGLFRKKDIEADNEISIKDEIWGEIFRLFDSYEWVVEERHEDAVVLTPSILGHIFEQSITGRKGKGAYYTPTEITEYISMNTIYPYLRDRLNERFGTGYRNVWSELLDREDLSSDEVDRVSYLYFNILKELRVLDNACGSGAFLMAAHRILLALYRKCCNILKDEMVFSAENKAIESYGSSDYYFKRLIATQNIYGVDLEEGAVEIAKLRLWLSMISDLSIESVEPLPNIDYNIMHGNSLIGFVEAPLIEQTTLDSSDTTMQIIKAKGALLNQYKATTDPKTAESLKRDIERINEKFRQELNEKFHRMLTVDYKIDISKEELEALHPFHWGFEFYELFDPAKPREERGFDVVIGNPPYEVLSTRETNNPLIKPQIKFFDATYETCRGKKNTYRLFIERTFWIMRENGEFGYIIPGTIIGDEAASNLRQFLFKNTENKGIYHFPEKSQIFSDVTQDVCIYLYRKGTPINPTVSLSFNLQSPVTLRNAPITQMEVEKIKQISGEGLTIPKATQKEFSILKHIHIFPHFKGDNETPPMGKIFQGEVNLTNFKDCLRFENTGNELIRGHDIKRYAFVDAIRNKEGFVDKDCFLRRSKGEKSRHHLVTRIVLQEVVNMQLKTRLNAQICPRGKFVGHTANYVIPHDDYHINYILALLNSSLLNWRFKLTSSNNHVSGNELRGLPFPRIDKKQQIPFIKIANFLIFNPPSNKSKVSDFFDTQLLDSLVYTLYFKEKFQEDGVPTNLAELVEPYLIDIEKLRSDEEKMAAIEKVYEEITADEEIMETVEKIKSHPWGRVVER
jgi:Alw26I/Eco31I/Esp3I family type II restriction m6 adenine DNA methyltransferase